MPQVLWLSLKRSLSKISKGSWGKLRKGKTKKMSYRSAEDQKYLPHVRSSDEGFEYFRAEKYPNFVHQPSSEIPKGLAQDVAWAFNKLESEGYFYRHWVIVQGKHVLTPVSRTLVGNPGMTYRYLGLRIFALPWTFRTDGRDLSEIEKACSVIGRLNQHLKETSCGILEKREAHAENEDEIQDTKIVKRTSAENTIQAGNTSQLENPPNTMSAVGTNKNSSNRLKESKRSDSHMTSNEEHRLNRSLEDILPKLGERTECTDSKEPSPVVKENSGTSGRPSHKRKRQETRAETIEEGTDFNVALINYMDPLNPELSLKPEPYYGLGPLAVSWHMDGNLVRGSTVAVYSYTCESAHESERGRDWMVGISKPFDEETPALAAPLASGDAYFMLADLSDTHRHCVIAGDQPRFASTHRVVDSGHATLDYIQARCQSALENLVHADSPGTGVESGQRPSLKSLDPEALQLAEEVHNEVEFEWLRQFWMQGFRHAAERSFWIKPMEDLEHSWENMELITKLAIDTSMDQESSQDVASIITTILPYIETRERQRCACINRYSPEVLLSIEPDRLPLYRPTWDDSDPSRPLPFTLSKVIRRLKARLKELQE